MSILGSFIGVDKYLDPKIRELTGARRDAVALWALFSDTIPDMKTTLLVDGHATVENILKTLDETLGAAGPDDTVIVSFSGHGTHNHRLVAHDTTLNSLTDTTISMSDIAQRFKTSRAKIVLCVLDCCFSGDAPARVLEDSPIPRELVTSYDEFAGRGRLHHCGGFPGDRHGRCPAAGAGLRRP